MRPGHQGARNCEDRTSSKIRDSTRIHLKILNKKLQELLSSLTSLLSLLSNYRWFRLLSYYHGQFKFWMDDLSFCRQNNEF